MWVCFLCQNWECGNLDIVCVHTIYGSIRCKTTSCGLFGVDDERYQLFWTVSEYNNNSSICASAQVGMVKQISRSA